jgi:hypothetical protein
MEPRFREFDVLQGVRQRYEFPGITMINQCDLKRSVQLNAASKQFIVVSTERGSAAAATPAPVPETPDAATQAQLGRDVGQGRRGGPPNPRRVISETITLTDTGERKELFGREARHIKTVLARQPGPNACESKTTRVETDGWYVDLPITTCVPRRARRSQRAPSAEGACTDRVETRRVGEAKTRIRRRHDDDHDDRRRQGDGKLEFDDGSDRPAGDLARRRTVRRAGRL